MLRRVRIRGYKSLRDVEVRFDRPLSIIVGANASGKSNLFDALALLSRMVTRPTLQEAFKEHRGTIIEAFSFGSEGLEGLIKQPSAEFSIEVDVELSPDTHYHRIQSLGPLRVPERSDLFWRKDDGSILVRPLRYGVVIQANATQGPLASLAIIHEYLRTLNSDFSERTAPNASIERTGNRIISQADNSPEPGMVSAASNRMMFAEGIEVTSTLAYAFHQEISRWRFYDLEPKAMREPAPLHIVTALSSNGSDIAAFFNSMQVEQPKQFEGIRRSLRLLIPQIEAFNAVVFPDNTLHLQITEGGMRYFSRVISDGTLRVLGLLALTNPLEPTTLLGIEEPENGVDPHYLRFIADLLKTTTEQRGSQVLVNTHSPLLPRYFSEDELIHCWQADGETAFESVATSGLWRDPITVERRLNRDDEAEPAAPLTPAL